METDKLIEALRNESRYKDKATLEIMDLCMMAADRLEVLNDFEQGQCAVMLVKLTEKDKQLAVAVEALHLSIATHATDERQIERLMRHYLAEANGPQEAGEVK